MDLNDEAAREALRDRLSAPFRGRKVISGLLPLAAFTPWVRMLHAAGAQRPLLIVTSRGAGEVPPANAAEVVYFEVPQFESMTEELRDHDRLARHLPAEVRAAVEAYDPDGEAVWLHGPFVVNEPVLGREVYGGRPAAWLALEDKLFAETLWAELDVPHAPSVVAPVAAESLRVAGGTLDRGNGVVWVGDARDGFNGGGEFTRWVVTEEDRDAAVAFFTPRCDQVRVMPFLDGVPCSIHGMVLPDGTAAFRPVELGILRGAGRQFVYGGQGSVWDPPEPDRAHMRELVRRTGEWLRGYVGYRGAFGIDGVMAVDGFLPTELNTRMAGGLNTLARSVDGDLFTLLQLNLLAGHDPEVTVQQLESWAVPAMDANRLSKVLGMSRRRLVEDAQELPVAWDGRDLRLIDGPGGADATVQLAPSAVGTFLRLEGDLLRAGDRIAPLNAALLRLADAELGAGFGEVEIAPDLRRAPG